MTFYDYLTELCDLGYDDGTKLVNDLIDGIQTEQLYNDFIDDIYLDYYEYYINSVYMYM